MNAPNAVQFFTQRSARANANRVRLRRMIEETQPDLVLMWGMWNLPCSLPAAAEALMPGRVAYYIGDYWPTLPSQFVPYWQQPARHGVNVLPKLLLRAAAIRMLAHEALPELEFANVMFPTCFMRDELLRQRLTPQRSAVIYGAVDTTCFHSCARQRNWQGRDGLSLLYVGRLTEAKGTHTAIEALGHLVQQRGYDHLKLTIVGAGDDNYTQALERLVDQWRLQSYVTFLGLQPREAMPDLYAQADVLLFTSIWDEPFGRVLVEAMAAGLAVVGTATGGAAEILVDNQNSLVFPPGDAASLAAQIARLAESPSLRRRLAEEGGSQTAEKFGIQRMTAEIEAFLEGIRAGG